MAMGSLSDSDDDFNPEINTTPLVDVMLVLLIIFIITIPVMNHAVKIDLPKASSQPDQVKPESINLSIDASGNVFWNEEKIDSGELSVRIAAAAQKQPQPELHLRAERTTQYEKVAQVMSAAQSGGLAKIGFVTDPDKK
ncbi:biopolymer transporter ExbD [Herbaspirillum seropedicae]|uniref:Biopolymer transport ExbD/TolR protein n=1 Tax=Herbaspirillum seropedicae (strain SmR1) TaxID=757424 RepID=D8IZ88_HERSS|nr:biopolymer transporter ExbD [Herbaspirillum seropedicae]ADJ62208.1 biopolymer transport ExbD/TolR protein [Herbaspirillum seropedicae SmR1]AKN64370.1 biopolymer transporter ExbD [Herbaspirillum seropedicae]MDR6396971.1 biopolymer transport protein ExbD [Herbaspirillum seropedicae]NQE27764.1 biopolymer transporter ExbD [Herbaspirillum seropedicae]UMU20290.1 biopolymer transporter ExbD [Herbaspirillum seropedicae]